MHETTEVNVGLDNMAKIYSMIKLLIFTVPTNLMYFKISLSKIMTSWNKKQDI